MVATAKFEFFDLKGKISGKIVKIGKKIVLLLKHVKRVIYQWLYTKMDTLMAFLKVYK